MSFWVEQSETKNLKIMFIRALSRLAGQAAPNPDLLLSTSDKSRQKRLSAHFGFSNNTSLRSVLAKFEAEPNFVSNKPTAPVGHLPYQGGKILLPW